MSDTAQSVLIFFLVLSPLYIPIAVTLVAAIADRRETVRTRLRDTAANSHAAIAGEEPQPLAGSRSPAAMAPDAEAA
ncbi:hypothetical protein [Mycolicibacterium moriokaense]|uniref:Uncharacterized protein n=1 Tax=Mycolicibacterium moriokaense TaxID=39691 RepID=A0A318HEA4_9MYCO|nr:hypothetical protein [Mycolicibacterium moriokaense]PXW99888.1 hypothetical protein C8E89_1385 [Mycolicibacterium moriokaense]